MFKASLYDPRGASRYDELLNGYGGVSDEAIDGILLEALSDQVAENDRPALNYLADRSPSKDPENSLRRFVGQRVSHGGNWINDPQSPEVRLADWMDDDQLDYLVEHTDTGRIWDHPQLIEDLYDRDNATVRDLMLERISERGRFKHSNQRAFISELLARNSTARRQYADRAIELIATAVPPEMEGLTRTLGEIGDLKHVVNIRKIQNYGLVHRTPMAGVAEQALFDIATRHGIEEVKKELSRIDYPNRRWILDRDSKKRYYGRYVGSTDNKVCFLIDRRNYLQRQLSSEFRLVERECLRDEDIRYVDETGPGKLYPETPPAQPEPSAGKSPPAKPNGLLSLRGSGVLLSPGQSNRHQI